eukprot:2876919-Rhodomonas_salina.4
MLCIVLSLAVPPVNCPIEDIALIGSDPLAPAAPAGAPGRTATAVSREYFPNHASADDEAYRQRAVMRPWQLRGERKPWCEVESEMIRK